MSLPDLRAALLDRWESLAEQLLSSPNRKLSNRRTWRFGSKGSVVVVISGPKRGKWFDHETNRGGGPLDLFRHNGGSRGSAIEAARAWIGDTASNTPKETTPARGPKTADAERQKAIADARQMWQQAGPIAGTLGERYLVDVRKIPSPDLGWPGMAVRYHASLLAIIIAATRDDGSVQAVQRIRLGPDGHKADDGKPVKLSRGPQDGAVVRLPARNGDGPLLIAEGPETGLSVWRATGFETWVALGSLAKIELPKGRRVVVCADDDPRRAGAGQSNTATTMLRKARTGWRKAGLDVVVAYPWPERRADKSDFNDVMQTDGLDTVQARIEAALNPATQGVDRISVDVAHDKLGRLAWQFAEAARSYQSPKRDETGPPPPVHAIRVDVGAGKSEAARVELATSFEVCNLDPSPSLMR